MNRTLHSDRGYALLSVVVMTGVLLVVGVATLQLTRSELHSTADHVAEHKAFYVADAGIQRGLAQLDQDRATAWASTSYAYAATESFGGGTYSVTIDQDPHFATDSTRKRIQSTGSFGPRQSTTAAFVTVQDGDPCALCFSGSGDCRVVANAAVGELFDGLIHGNEDVEFDVVTGTASADGTVQAVNDIVVTGVALPSPTGANAFRGGNYQGPVGDTHLLDLKVGVHFNNPADGHGVQQTVAARRYPRPDYDRIKRDPSTEIVNGDNVPFGTWDSSSDTWQYTGNLAIAADATKVYYVDGNTRLTSIQLVKGAQLTVVARGWLAVNSVTLLSTGLIPNGNQRLALIAEDELAIGRQVLSNAPTFVAEAAALADPLSPGLSLASVVNTNNYLFAYSENSWTWTKLSAVGLLSAAKVSLMGRDDTTLAYTGAIQSPVGCAYTYP